MTSSLIFESKSPDGTLYALVEDDGRCVMLNLAPARHLQGRVPFRPCWVRNRVAAPERFDPSPAREGRPPLQPAPHCVDPGPRPALDVEALRVVWLQEGDGVALFEGDTLLAALPAWAGTREQPGYSAEAVGRGPMAWALHDAVDLKARIAADEAWWRSWEHDPFSPVRDAQHDAVEAQLGAVQRYFAIDGDRWPPRAMVIVDRPPGRIITTLAMGLRRQPQAELHLGDSPGRRVELALALHPSITDPDPWLRAVASMASIPWRTASWLGSGHTITNPSLPPPFSAIFLHPSPPEGVTLTLPDIDDEPVLVLWGTAITAAERALAQEYGRDKLVERLGEALGQVRERAGVA